MANRVPNEQLKLIVGEGPCGADGTGFATAPNIRELAFDLLAARAEIKELKDRSSPAEQFCQQISRARQIAEGHACPDLSEEDRRAIKTLMDAYSYALVKRNVVEEGAKQMRRALGEALAAWERLHA